MSVPPAERLRAQRLQAGLRQGLRTIAGMVGVVTAVLGGSSVALLCAVIFDHKLAPALIVGGLVAGSALVALMRFQAAAWARASAAPLTAEALDELPTAD